ncbi:hypothetical protein [Staphylococcus cohnii]|uniref:hypothetical protein n=1 Tax=Staphylococcus cohnii TaxID=29382 RepID=UPI003AC9F29E
MTTTTINYNSKKQDELLIKLYDDKIIELSNSIVFEKTIKDIYSEIKNDNNRFIELKYIHQGKSVITTINKDNIKEYRINIAADNFLDYDKNDLTELDLMEPEEMLKSKRLIAANEQERDMINKLSNKYELTNGSINIILLYVMFNNNPQIDLEKTCTLADDVINHVDVINASNTYKYINSIRPETTQEMFSRFDRTEPIEFFYNIYGRLPKRYEKRIINRLLLKIDLPYGAVNAIINEIYTCFKMQNRPLKLPRIIALIVGTKVRDKVYPEKARLVEFVGYRQDLLELNTDYERASKVLIPMVQDIVQKKWL